MPKVWIKAFWGFDPGNAGYIGFTRDVDRDNLMAQITEDDLVLIYGADSPETDTENRRQALGFLQVEPRAIMDVDRLSEAGLARKIEKETTERWTFAMPVKRAWRVERRIEIKHLAPTTYTHQYARVIASQGRQLTEAEADTVMQLPVREVSVYGEQPVTEEAAQEATMRKIFMPSRGVTPTFGSRTSIYEDGECYLYMLRYDGDPEAMLGKQFGTLNNKAIVKVGMSKDATARCGQLNCGFPDASLVRWILWRKSRAFESALDAEAAESALKADFAAHYQSLGGEFFLGRLEDMESRFAMASASTAFTIKV